MKKKIDSKKRKSSYDNFIDDQEDNDQEDNCIDDDDLMDLNELCDGKPNSDVIKLNKIIKENKFNINKIAKMDIPLETKLWFYEYLQIFKNMDPFTVERYEVKQQIQQKYNDLLKKNKKTIDIEEQLKQITKIDKNILQRIIESNHDNYVKGVLYKKYSVVHEMEDTDEKFKIINFIETVLDIPTELTKIKNGNDVNMMLNNLEKTLDDNIYGLSYAKERLLEIYCAMLSNPSYKKKCLAFVGPPGTGKTAFARTIAQSMGLPFGQISMGSVKDAATLTGHGFTYIGAQAGLFVSTIKQLKTLNCVIFLDEIDKIPNTVDGHSISSVLLHVLDKTQNNSFQDMYMPDIKIDLSNVLFLVAMNDDSSIDPILKDRLHIINIAGYDTNDKINIGLNFSLPKMLENLQMKKTDLIINPNVMKYIIEFRSPEPGVRQMERDLTTICEKINVAKHLSSTKGKNVKKIKLSYWSLISDYTEPFTLQTKHVDMLLV
jgi:ATP-dependent Lon protease